MNYLVNIYKAGLIVKTHIFETEEKAVEAFNTYVETLEDTFDKATCMYTCTPTEEETTKTNNKNKKS
jgi:hypothetical protein